MSEGNAPVGDPCQMGHVAIEGRQVIERKVGQPAMPTRSGKDPHEIDSALEEPGEPPGRLIDGQSFP